MEVVGPSGVFKAASAEQKGSLLKAMSELFYTMHRVGVLHGDAHSGNVLYKVPRAAADSEAAVFSGQFRLIDFEGAQIMSNPATELMRNYLFMDFSDAVMPLCQAMFNSPFEEPLQDLAATLQGVCKSFFRVRKQEKAEEMDVLKLEEHMSKGEWVAAAAMCDKAAPPPRAQAAKPAGGAAGLLSLFQ